MSFEAFLSGKQAYWLSSNTTSPLIHALDTIPSDDEIDVGTINPLRLQHAPRVREFYEEGKSQQSSQEVAYLIMELSLAGTVKDLDLAQCNLRQSWLPVRQNSLPWNKFQLTTPTSCRRGRPRFRPSNRGCLPDTLSAPLRWCFHPV